MKPINTLTITEALDLLEKKQISSVELTESCLAVSEARNKELNAYVSIFRDSALAAAKRADKLRSQGSSLALLGIPIALKDNFLTQGMRTTASSKVLDNYLPQYDATVTRRLIDAGVVIVGKTNMDAWAHGSSTETSDYGPSRNPYDTSRLPGGSSGGSAVVVAADLAIGAIGSETAGSVRGPASWCGVIGLKPTYGRVSRYGVVAMGSSLDSPGTLTKTVTDSALMLSVIAGKDPYDATSSPFPVLDYRKNITSSVKGMKIGLPKEYFMQDTQPGINELVKKAASKFQELGAELTGISLIDPKYSIAEYTLIMRSEVSSNLARYDGIRYGNDRSFFGAEAKRRIVLGTYALSSGYYDAYYKNALRVRRLMKEDYDRVFEKVDVILAPTLPSTALKVGSTVDDAMYGELADVLVEASSLAGLTGINVPCGLIEGLPVGMQIVANHFQEQKIINAAHTYEQSVDWKENSL